MCHIYKWVAVAAVMVIVAWMTGNLIGAALLVWR
jgi:hypothetical protein